MSPLDTTPIVLPRSTICVSCDQELRPGEGFRCRLCVQAAVIACQEATTPGVAVRHGDVMRVRERMKS